MRHATLPLLLALCTACAPSVIPMYEAARDEALADPGPAPENWSPDAVLVLSAPLVDEALEGILAEHGTLKGDVPLGPVTATSKLDQELAHRVEVAL